MKTGLLWVTHGKDFPWFEVSARSYARWGKAFAVAKCIVPNPDVELFKPACDAAGIHLVGFDQHPTKGMLHHEVMVCYSDLHFPSADFVFHIDADIVFAMEARPEQYFEQGKPIICYHDFSELLTTPEKPNEMTTFMGCEGTRMDFFRGRYSWKFCADFALGWPAKRATMIDWPLLHRKETYLRTRDIIAKRHGMPFEDYVFSCRNEFPQSFCEFETLGSVAHRYFGDRYHWRNASTTGLLPPRLIGSWSHGGFDRPHTYASEWGGHQTPRQLFQRLGLL